MVKYDHYIYQGIIYIPPGGFSIAGISSINICQSARLCCFLAVYRGSEGFTKEEVESLKQLFDSEAVS